MTELGVDTGSGLDLSLTAACWSIWPQIFVAGRNGVFGLSFRPFGAKKKCGRIDYIPLQTGTFLLASLGEVISGSVENNDVKAASSLFTGDDFRRMTEAWLVVAD